MMTSMKTKTQKLNEKIRERATVLGFSVSGLAREVGVPERTVYRWYAGHSVPKLEHVVKLATVLGIPLDVLVH